MPGLGTIVTGSLQGSPLSVNDDLVLLPSGKTAFVKGLQSRGTVRQSIEPGERTAANIRGLSVTDISVGDVLCTPGAFASSVCLDVALTVLPGVKLKHMQDLRLHIGTACEVATLRLYGGGRSEPDAPVLAQLRPGKAVCAYAGQNAVLRRLSPAETLGGAVILDPEASPTGAGDKDRQRILHAALDGDPGKIALALCHAGRGVAEMADIARLARLDPSDARDRLMPSFSVLGDRRIAPTSLMTEIEVSMLAALSRYHENHPLHAVAPISALEVRGTSPDLCRHIRNDLLRRGTIRMSDNGVAAANHDPMTRLTADHRTRMAGIETAFQDAGLDPISPETLLHDPADHDLFDLLKGLGRLVALPNIALKQTLVFHADALMDAATTLRAAFPMQEQFTTSQARSALSTSRRVIVPVLEHLDAAGVTLRRENTRHLIG